jgi:predicted  nucleic acid-binding Zn-ribbon protein
VAKGYARRIANTGPPARELEQLRAELEQAEQRLADAERRLHHAEERLDFQEKLLGPPSPPRQP